MFPTLSQGIKKGEAWRQKYVRLGILRFHRRPGDSNKKLQIFSMLRVPHLQYFEIKKFTSQFKFNTNQSQIPHKSRNSSTDVYRTKPTVFMASLIHLIG
jgi:hypothetical protein